MNSKEKGYYLFVKFTVSFGLIGFLFYKIDVKGLLSRLQSLDIIWFMIMLAIPHLNILLSTFKWKLLLGSLNIFESLERLFVTYMIGTFFSNFLPSMVGGDVVRILHLSGNNTSTAGIIAATFAERLIGLTALVSIFVFLLCNGKVYSVFPLIAELAPVVLILYFLLLLLVFQRKYLALFKTFRKFKIGIKIFDLVEGAQVKMLTYSKMKKTILFSYIISLFFYLMSMLTVYVAAKSLHVNVEFYMIMLVVPLVLLVGMLPISIGGLGLNESSYVFFFTMFGMSSIDAFSIAFLLRLRILLTGIIGGLLSVNHKKILTRKESPN